MREIPYTDYGCPKTTEKNPNSSKILSRGGARGP